MQKTVVEAGTATGSWKISTETKNGVVTGFAVMSEEPKRAVPGTGQAAERRTGGVDGTKRDRADAPSVKAAR